jgi:cytochrome b pre-mRNA-processing protein 3
MTVVGRLPQDEAGAQTGSNERSWSDRVLGPFRRHRARDEAARQLYRALVEQARQPVFYSEWGVPDSRDGRLQLVSLHAILMMRRLRDEGPAGRELAQSLFDLMFQDVDRHLREWGVGDLSVGKQVKQLAQSFLGHAAALDPPLATGDSDRLARVLRRNVYSEVAAPESGVAHLVAYVLAQASWLTRQDGPALLAGRIRFAPAT